MKQSYRLIRRAGDSYLHNNFTNKQENLHTRSRNEACRLFHAKNKAYRRSQVSLHIACAYLGPVDPELLKRTWQDVMDAVRSTKHSTSLKRWQSAMRETPFDLVRALPVSETRAKHLLAKGTTSRSANN